MNLLRKLVRGSAFVAGAGIIFIMLVTCTDVILRRFGHTLPGAYDLVRLGGGVTIAASLPLTTAVKGHVAIEYFFHRLGRRGRVFVDSCMRSLQTIAFLFAAVAFLRSGFRLLKSGEEMPTLQCHIFWLAWVISAMALLTAAVSFVHLVHPKEEFIR